MLGLSPSLVAAAFWPTWLPWTLLMVPVAAAVGGWMMQRDARKQRPPVPIDLESGHGRSQTAVSLRSMIPPSAADTSNTISVPS